MVVVVVVLLVVVLLLLGSLLPLTPPLTRAGGVEASTAISDPTVPTSAPIPTSKSTPVPAIAAGDVDDRLLLLLLLLLVGSTRKGGGGRYSWFSFPSLPSLLFIVPWLSGGVCGVLGGGGGVCGGASGGVCCGGCASGSW